MPQGQPIQIERRVLLLEIERRCRFAHCNQRVSVALTKSEALEYRGYDCPSCERWNDDVLTPRDVPDWWDEIHANLRVN
jgi:hypothetical protein